MRYFLFTFLSLWLIFVIPAQALEATDLFASELWYIDAISASTAWEQETGTSQTIVAVLDAGFDLDHEDLLDRYFVNSKEIKGDKKDNDGNGFEDDIQGWDFVDSDPIPAPDIEHALSDTIISHGTAIAGIIGAAGNNGIGITGITWNVRIMPLRVLNAQGTGSTTDVRRAIEYAVQNGADIINLSFTFTVFDERLQNTIRWAHDQGVVVVAAIGNGGVDTDITPVYPACFKDASGNDLVIGVASTNRNNEKASFSNFGTTCVDLAAPGVDLFTAVYHDETDISFITSYASPWEGTSLSAPMVAGAAALLRSAYPSLTPDQIRNALKLSVDPVAERSLEARKRLGAGRLNSSRALEFAKTFALGSSNIMTNIHHSSGSLVTSQARGFESIVRRVNSQGEILVEFQAYPSGFTGGVRVAMGDVDGDGIEEIVTGAGPGGGPHVRVFDLQGQVKHQFFAFEPGDRHGIFIATGDVNGDGMDEILVTQDTGGTGQIRIFNRHGHLKGAYFPFGRTSTSVRVATGNVDDDPEAEIVSVQGKKSNGRVLVHDGNGRYVLSLTSFDTRVTSLSLAAQDLNADGFDEIILASGEDHNPRVWVYNSSGKELLTFFAYPYSFTGGVEIASGDSDQNGKGEIYVFPQTKGGPHIRIFDQTGKLIGSFFAFDAVNRSGGSIAIW